MAKLTKKQKIQLLRQEDQLISQNEKNKIPSIFAIIKENYVIIISLIILCLTVYFNSLDNQLTLVDDFQSFVYDDRTQDMAASLKSLHIQKIFYAISYYFFDYSPLPLRISAVALHTLAAILVFIFVYLLYGRKIATISSFIFSVHPINTEAVTWISGSPYLYITLFLLIMFVSYVYYKKLDKKIYLYLSAFVYILSLILIQAPWVLITPIALIILDQFFLEKKINISSLWWIILFTIPMSIYLVTYFTGAYKDRVEYREGEGNRVTLNAQALKPVIEGYPYTTFMMSKLYLFPKDLTIYYDGTPITNAFYISMYLFFIFYLFFTIYIWRKDRQLAGIMIILPILIAPTYSPVKVTWFLAERYLYSGTIFFSIFVSLILKKIQQKYKLNEKVVWGVVGMLVVCLSIRTIYRNRDWQDTKTLSLASMQTSPLSVRPYNDMGGHYYYEGDNKTAMEYYERGLEVVPTSGTGISNLGYLYLEDGPLIFMQDYYKKFDYNPELAKKYFDAAVKQVQIKGDQKLISFFLNRAVAHQPDSTSYLLNLGDFYLSVSLKDYSDQIYNYVLSIDPANEHAKLRLGI